MIVYASKTDLEAWTGTAQPDTVTPLLREASALVRNATKCDLYDATPAGLPADPDLAEAMRDATCRQAEFWAASGIDPIAGTIAGRQVISASEVDGAKVTFNNQLAMIAARQQAAGVGALCGPALEILRNAGLASPAVRDFPTYINAYGPSNYYPSEY
jgi:hypothetical protein